MENNVVFKKQELDFLDVFKSLSDTKQYLSDKFQIKIEKENNRVIFSQFSTDAVIIKEFENRENLPENFSCIFPIVEVAQLISFCNADADISLGLNTISFNNSNYNFNDVDGDFSHTNIILEGCKNASLKKYTIFDIKKLGLNRSYIGEDNLGTVGIFKNYFVSSNQSDVSACIYNSNNHDDSIYLSKSIYNIFSHVFFKNLNSIDFYVSQDYTLIIKDSLYIAFNNKDYTLPDLTKETYKGLYDHPYKVIVSKDEFLKALKRINVFTTPQTFNRVFIKYVDQGVELTCKDGQKGKETISVKHIDSELVGEEQALSASFLSSIISCLTGDDIYIFTNNNTNKSDDEKIVAIKITDERNEDFFIHNLYSLLVE